MAKAGSQIIQWNENEAAVSEARVRNLQLWQVDDLIAKEQNIHVDHAWAIADAPRSAEIAFDLVQRFEQFVRLAVPLHLDDAIQKPRLLAQIHRLGFIQRALANHPDVSLPETGDRAGNVSIALSQVRSQR